MTTGRVTVGDYIRYVADVGEKSDVSVEVNNRGILEGRKVTPWEEFYKRPHKDAYRESWRRFSESIREAYGETAWSGIFNRIAVDKPLTTRDIVAVTKQAQAEVRRAALGAYQSLSGDKSALAVFKEYRIADIFVELSSTDEFRSASDQEKLAALSSKLRAGEENDDALPADKSALGLTGFSRGVDMVGAGETSVEDLVAAGKLRPGDRMGADGSYVFLGLKTKGVEPGFLVGSKWTVDHDSVVTGPAVATPPHSDLQQASYDIAGKKVLDWLRADNPPGILQALETFCGSPEYNLSFLRQLFALDPETCNDKDLIVHAETLARDFAVSILRGGPPDKLARPLMRDVRYAMLQKPEFKGMSIVKLDYNESERVLGRFKLPKRIVDGVKKWFNRLVRNRTSSEINEGAVAEALANDLTRIFGVPAQKLRLVKGSYSDGKPKLLLEGEYVAGRNGAAYRDFDYFIRDGYLDKHLMAAAGHHDEIRRLGSYKAALLLLGDRDGVGSHGQNKGFVNNSFAAIDPGHSLEGRTIRVNDDFSFSIGWNARRVFEKWFANFTLFDDCPLSEKMAGWNEIEKQMAGPAVNSLFMSYFEQFSGQTAKDAGLDFSEKIGDMADEIAKRYSAMHATLAPRLALFNSDNGPQLLDALDNVEKLTSETSATSPKGKVDLDYLRVVKRTPWDMERTEDGVRLRPRGLDQNGASALCARVGGLARAGGFEPPPFRISDDGSILVSQNDITAFCGLFTDVNVRAMKAAGTNVA